MALIIIGSTKCALCGKILLQGDDIRGLPAFADEGQPMYEYSDAAFHAHCYDRWPEREEALRLIEVKKQELIDSDYFKEMLAKYGWPDWLKQSDI